LKQKLLSPSGNTPFNTGFLYRKLEFTYVFTKIIITSGQNPEIASADLIPAEKFMAVVITIIFTTGFKG